MLYKHLVMYNESLSFFAYAEYLTANDQNSYPWVSNDLDLAYNLHSAFGNCVYNKQILKILFRDT